MNEHLIWQYRGKSNAKKTVTLLHNETSTAFKAAIALSDVLNIDKATGYALDLVGRHVGINRTLKSFISKEYFGWLGINESKGFGEGVFYRYGNSLNDMVSLTDEDYRFFIKSKITKNYQKPTIINITNSVKNLLGDEAFVIDNYNMSMNIVIPSHHLTPFRLYAISKMDILCRPIGVRYQYIVITGKNTFGWNGDDSAFGFNKGVFARIINASN